MGGVVAALVVAAVVLTLTGRNPLSLLWKALDGTFGERQGMEEMGLLLTPILMNALAVHIALRMKIWNIGSEGQFFMGAWAAAGIGIHWGGPRVPRAARDGPGGRGRRRGVDPRARRWPGRTGR